MSSEIGLFLFLRGNENERPFFFVKGNKIVKCSTEYLNVWIESTA